MEWLSPVRDAFESFLPFLDSLPAVRAILGVLLVFFLPGFAWTLIFFNGRQINIIERLAISIGLSITLVTLSMLALNRLINFRVTGFNVLVIIAVITTMPIAIYYFRRLRRRREPE